VKACWAFAFLPTLYACLGAAPNPWQPYNDHSSLLEVVQELVNFTYPGSGYKVRMADKIFMLVRIIHFVERHTLSIHYFSLI
jgi:hypothetical protein